MEDNKGTQGYPGNHTPAPAERKQPQGPESRQRLFVDMDGTLAVFQKTQILETLYEKLYFRNLPPQTSVVEAVRFLAKTPSGPEVFILSSVLSDSPYALEEKNAWLDQYLLEIDREHRIFPPCGRDKKEYLPGGIRETDVLLDDYTKNLALWEPPAKGIKLLNGSNHTHGTWKGAAVSCHMAWEGVAAGIVQAMEQARVARAFQEPTQSLQKRVRDRKAKTR